MAYCFQTCLRVTRQRRRCSLPLIPIAALIWQRNGSGSVRKVTPLYPLEQQQQQRLQTTR